MNVIQTLETIGADAQKRYTTTETDLDKEVLISIKKSADIVAFLAPAEEEKKEEKESEQDTEEDSKKEA